MPDAIVLCVFTDDQVKQICLEGDLVAGMAPGFRFDSPHHGKTHSTAQAIAERFAPHVFDVIDAR